MRLRGIEPGPSRQPKSEVQIKELAKLSDQLQCLLAAEGFTKEPGQTAVDRAVDGEQVARIVDTVLGELRKQGLA